MLKNIWMVRYILVFLLILVFCKNYTSAYQEILIENRWGHAIRVIKVVLDWEHFVVSSVADEWWETIQSLTKKVWWMSSINWAFFCPKDYSSCNKRTFSYYERVFRWDGASYSMFWPDTSVRGIFWFSQDGNPLFVQNKISLGDVWLESNINADRIFDLYFWISNFPVLLIEWDDVTRWSAEYIDSKLTGKWTRNFICSTQDGKTIYMWFVGSIWVWDMAPYLKKHFWCYNALFLDAWASLAMAYSGDLLTEWSRKLITDAFVVVDRESFLKLWWTPSENHEPYIPDYVMTDHDWLEANKYIDIVDKIYQKYGKSKYQSKLISIFKKRRSESESLSEKSIYNQALIRTFRIWEL